MDSVEAFGETFPVDASEYRPTKHVAQRVKYRHNPRIPWDVIGEMLDTFDESEIHQTPVSDRYHIKRDVRLEGDTHGVRLTVAVRDRLPYYLLTACCKCHSDGNENCVSG